MLVYRIENAGGIGPFSTDDDADAAFIAFELCSHGFSTEQHPLPSLPDGVVDLRPYHFGFNSIEQMMSWFDTNASRRSLEKSGFELSVYETDDYYEINKQVIFIRNKATKIETLTLGDI